jgi:hypothetical protein
VRSLACAALIPLALAACARPAPRPPTVATADDLWRHAPAGSKFSLVATGPAVTTGLASTRTIVASMRRVLDPARAAEVDALFRHAGIDLLADGAQAELDASRGLALFAVHREPIVLYPARDPARFAKARARGRVCRPYAGYVACAATADELDRLGTGGADAARTAAARPAHLRGPVEFAEGGTSATGAILVERGAVEARFHVSAPQIGSVIPPLVGSPLIERVRMAPVSGALVIDLRPVLPLLVANGDPSIAAALTPFRGDLAAVTLAGPEIRGWLAIGVADQAAAQAMIDGCGALSTPTLELRASGGRCRVTPNLPYIPLPAFEARLDGDILVVESAAAFDTRGAPAPEIAALVEVPALLAVWGRGMSWRSSIAPAKETPEAALVQWLVDRIDEMGVVVRPAEDGLEVTFRLGTVYRNDDEAVARLEALLAPDEPPATVAAGLTALASAQPASPLARSLALGPAGTLLPVSAVGVFAAIALPALLADGELQGPVGIQ